MKRSLLKTDPNKSVTKKCKGCGERFTTTAARQLVQTCCGPLCELKLKKPARPSHTSEEHKWQQAIRERDGYRCQRCGVHDPHIDTHHVASRKQRPDLKYEVSNGVALDRECHRWVHDHPIQAKAEGFVSDARYEARHSG
jgi:hypothetical protein